MDPDHNPREDRSESPDALAATAERWVSKRDVGLTVAERRELRSWIERSPQHATAFSTADRSGTELDWPLHTGTIDEVLTQLDARARQRSRRRRTLAASGALAASVLLMIGLFSRVDPRDSSRPSAGASSTLLVLEPQRRVLPDGTRVELSEGAQVSLAFDAATRVVTLTRGAAHFEVTKEGRPFIVKAGGISARALGTVFVVERNLATVSVLVTEGRVAVDQEPDPASAPTLASQTPDASPTPVAVLDAGKTVSVMLAAAPDAPAPQVNAMSADEVRARLSWRVPRLEFNGTPLAEAIAMVNRYNREQFVITDPSLARLAVSGVLRADKIDALVEMLESDFHLRIERRAGRVILSKAH